jgi:hypothetical protein
LSSPVFADSKQTLYTWTDEKGVIRITKEPPPEGIKALKRTYEAPKRQPEPAVHYPVRKENILEQLERQEQREEDRARSDAMRREAEQRQKDAEKREKQRKIDYAIREYEGMKLDEERYKYEMNSARTEDMRLFYKSRLQGIEDAKRRLDELQE